MNSKLEEKLIQYDKTTAISTSQELLDAIDYIIDNEMALPDNEVDVDLIKEATETAKILRNVDIEQRKKEADAIAKEIIAEVNSQNVPPKQKTKRHLKKRWILPIAAITTLIIASAVVSYSFDGNEQNGSKRSYTQSRKNVILYGDDASVHISDDTRVYKDFDEMIGKENVTELLWPSDLDSMRHIDDIVVSKYDWITQIFCLFNIGETKVEYFVYAGGPWSPEPEQYPVAIGGFDVCVSEYDETYQADFKYKNSMYTVKADTYEVLESFIKSLEEKCS